MSTRAALIGIAVFAMALMGCGAVLNAIGPSKGHGTAPAVLPARVTVLDPATGAVMWRSFGGPARVVINPATGAEVSSSG